MTNRISELAVTINNKPKKKKKKERVIPGCMQLELQQLSEKKKKRRGKTISQSIGGFKNDVSSQLFGQWAVGVVSFKRHRMGNDRQFFSPTFFFPAKRVNGSQWEFNFPPPVEARENQRPFANLKNKTGRLQCKLYHSFKFLNLFTQF